MPEAKYPEAHIVVDKMGESGNAFFILAAARREMRRIGVTPEDIDLYDKEATSSDYDNLCAVTESWIRVTWL